MDGGIMPSNTTYNPLRVLDFTKDNLNFTGQSIYFQCNSDSTAQCDLDITDDVLLTGGILLVKNGKFTDRIYLQVVHPSLGVLSEFVSGFRVAEDSNEQFKIDLPYPAKIPAGLKLRCKYVSSNDAGTRDVAVNFFLHKVLV
jgi:hypothetical protein